LEGPDFVIGQDPAKERETTGKKEKDIPKKKPKKVGEWELSRAQARFCDKAREPWRETLRKGDCKKKSTLFSRATLGGQHPLKKKKKRVEEKGSKKSSWEGGSDC